MQRARSADDTEHSRTAGENVARVRRKRGLSQKALASRVQSQGHNLSSTRLLRIEGGRSSAGHPTAMTVDELIWLSAALEVPPDSLMSSASYTSTQFASAMGWR